MTLRKRFSKEFLSSTDLSHTHVLTHVNAPAHTPELAPAQREPHYIQLLQINNNLKQVLDLELANHAKYQLSVRDPGFSKLS